MRKTCLQKATREREAADDLLLLLPARHSQEGEREWGEFWKEKACRLAIDGGTDAI